MPGSNIDFVHGIDPTGFASITGAQLAQLIDSATPYTDKGLVISTTDNIDGTPNVPDASATTKWQRYLWLRIGAVAVTPYVWNNNTNDVTLKGWTSVAQSSLGPDSILTSMIKNGAVTNEKIASGLDASKLVGTLPPALSGNFVSVGDTPTSGDMTGYYPNLVIDAAKVTLSKMAKQAVTGSTTLGDGTIVDGSVEYIQLASTGGTPVSSFPGASAGGVDIGSNVIIPPKSFAGTPASSSAAGVGSLTPAPGDVVALNYGPSGTPDGYCTMRKGILKLAELAAVATERVVRIASNATDYSLLNPQGSSLYGRYLQMNSNSVTTSVAVSVTTADAANLAYNTANLQDVTSAAFASTTAGTKHAISVAGSMYLPNGKYGWVYLYNATGAAAPIAALRIENGAGNASNIPFCLRFVASNAGTAAVTYYIKYGGSSGIQVAKSGDTTTLIIEETL